MRAGKELSCFICSIISLFFLALLSKLTGTAAFIIIAMSIMLIVSVYTRNIATLRYFVFCTVFQNILLILIASGISSGETTLIVILKELVVYFCLIVYFVRNRLVKPDKKDWVFMLFVLIAILDLVRGDSLNLGIVALRQIMVIFTCYYFGNSLRLNSLKGVYTMLLFYSVLVGLIGVLLYFCSDQTWLNLGFAEFWENKSNGNKLYSFVNFYTYDLGVRMKRLVSTFADPLACSHFVGIGFLVVFLTGKGKNYFYKIFLTIVMILGITKSSVVLIVCTVITLNYSKIKSRKMQRFFVFTCILAGALGVGVLSMHTRGQAQATSIGIHLDALIYGLKNASLFGNGLGTTGYNASIMGLADYDSGYNESFFALCMGQIGMSGVALIYVFLVLCLLTNYRAYKSTGNRYMLVSLILSVDLLIETLFSASSVSMLGTGLYCVLSGITCRLYHKEYSTNECRHHNLSRSA